MQQYKNLSNHQFLLNIGFMLIISVAIMLIPTFLITNMVLALKFKITISVTSVLISILLNYFIYRYAKGSVVNGNKIKKQTAGLIISYCLFFHVFFIDYFAKEPSYFVTSFKIIIATIIFAWLYIVFQTEEKEDAR